MLMADLFTKKKRSEIMSKVKGRGNAATELRLAGIFREFEISGWRRRAVVFGNPDFVFPKARLAVFVDGCFWHGCPDHASWPSSNRTFWRNKFERNKGRDRIVNRTLRAKGWQVLRIWQHELRRPANVARRLAKALSRGSHTRSEARISTLFGGIRHAYSC
jgi:DNA mismatch endonuclease (patch repair protein)